MSKNKKVEPKEYIVRLNVLVRGATAIATAYSEEEAYRLANSGDFRDLDFNTGEVSEWDCTVVEENT